MMTRTIILPGLLFPPILGDMTAADHTVSIDRQALVARHTVERDQVDPDPRSALQVGNGEFVPFTFPP